MTKIVVNNLRIETTSKGKVIIESLGPLENKKIDFKHFKAAEEEQYETHKEVDAYIDGIKSTLSYLIEQDFELLNSGFILK